MPFATHATIYYSVKTKYKHKHKHKKGRKEEMNNTNSDEVQPGSEERLQDDTRKKIIESLESLANTIEEDLGEPIIKFACIVSREKVVGASSWDIKLMIESHKEPITHNLTKH